MTHRAQQIADAAASLLQASVDLDAAVFTHRTLALSDEEQELPAVCVRLGSDSPMTDVGASNLKFLDSLLTVNVVAYAQANSEEEVGEELMRLRSQVHQILLANRTLSLSFVIDTRYQGADAPDIEAIGAQVAGRLESNFAVHYRMNLTSPE
jgi:hypothetical protein